MAEISGLRRVSIERVRAVLPRDRAASHAKRLAAGKRYTAADLFIVKALEAYPGDGHLLLFRAQANDKLGFHDMSGPLFREAAEVLQGKDQREARENAKRADRLNAREQQEYINQTVNDLCEGRRTAEIAKWMGYAAVPSERVDAIFDRLRSLTTSATPDFVSPIRACRDILRLPGEEYYYARCRADDLLREILDPFYMRVLETRRNLSPDEAALMKILIEEGEFIAPRVLEATVERLLIARKKPKSFANSKAELLQLMFKCWVENDYKAGITALREGLLDPEKNEAAIRHFERAIEALPSDPSKYIGKMTALRQLRRFDELIRTAETALAIRQLDDDSRYMLLTQTASALLDSSMCTPEAMAKANGHIETAIRLRPEKAIAYHLRSIYIVRRNKKAGKEYFDAIEKMLERMSDMPKNVILPILDAVYNLYVYRFYSNESVERADRLFDQTMEEAARRICSSHETADIAAEVVIPELLVPLALVNSPLAKEPRRMILEIYLSDRYKGTRHRVLALKAHLTDCLFKGQNDEVLVFAKEVIDAKDISDGSAEDAAALQEAKLYAYDIIGIVMIDRAQDAPDPQEKTKLFELARDFFVAIPDSFLEHPRLSGGLARAYEGLREYQSAKEVYSEMIERDKEELIAYSGFARAAHICQFRKEAAVHLRILNDKISALAESEKRRTLNDRTLLADMMSTYCGYQNGDLLLSIKRIRQAFPEAYSDALELLNDVQKDRILRAFPAKKAEAA